MKRWTTGLAVALIALASFLVFPETGVSGEDPTRIPDDATAKTLDGKTVSLADHRGKLVFLVIWKTDCKACMHEIPILNRLQKEYSSEDFTVIGLSKDRDKDSLVAEVVKHTGIAYPVWLGHDQPIAKYTDTPVFPCLLVIDPDGKVLGYIAGAFPTYEAAVEAMKTARRLIETTETVK